MVSVHFSIETMTETQTLLRYLAQDLSIRKLEDLATEALGYILRGGGLRRNGPHRLTECTKSVLQQIFSQSSTEEMSYLDTQKTTPQGLRPDLWLSNGEGEPIGFIEVKRYAGLQPGQPFGYLEGLSAQRPGFCCLLVPKATCTPVWAAVERKAREKGRLLSQACVQEGLKWAAVEGCDPARAVAVLSWDYLIWKLEECFNDDKNASCDIHQLKGLCDVVDKAQIDALAEDELSQLRGAQIFNMMKLLKELKGRFEDEGFKLKEGSWWGETGFHMAATDNIAGRLPCNLWIGLCWEKWASNGFPFWVAAQPNESQRRQLLQTFPGQAVEDRDWIYVPLAPKPGEEPERVTSSLLKQIHGVVERLAQH